MTSSLVEIKSGLNQGDEVVIGTSSQQRNGTTTNGFGGAGGFNVGGGGGNFRGRRPDDDRRGQVVATLPMGPHADGGMPPGGVLPAGATGAFRCRCPGGHARPEPIVSLDRVSRTYAMDGVHVDALKDA